MIHMAYAGPHIEKPQQGCQQCQMSRTLYLACLCFQMGCSCNDRTAGKPVLQHSMQHALLPIQTASQSKRLPYSAGTKWLL